MLFRFMDITQILLPSETAADLFKRGRGAAIPLGWPSIDQAVGGLRGGEVVELYGLPSTGKTQLLLHAIASMILPKAFGGSEVGVVFFDLDYTFSASRLLQFAEQRICKRGNVADNSTMAPRSLAMQCLQRVRVFRCRESIHFLACLKSLLPLLQDESQGIRVIAIDSLSSFYWPDKYLSKIGGVLQQQLIRILQDYVQEFNLILLASKSALVQYKQHDVPTESQLASPNRLPRGMTTDQIAEALRVLPPHREVLHNTWGMLVKHRVVVGKGGPKVETDAASGATFLATWHYAGLELPSQAPASAASGLVVSSLFRFLICDTEVYIPNI